MTRALLALCLALAPVAGAAQCRLALLLALDVSSSVDAREYALQRDGVASALVSDSVQGAILQGGGAVALGIYEWSGRRQSVVLQDWVTLRSAADIAAVAERLRGASRSFRRFPTALGYALGFGATMMQRAPECDRQVIDVSGDGITNDGFWPQLAYRHFPFERITVNGLAVLGADPAVVDHFEFEVLHGPGAFLETAEGYEGYARAMERKLYREIQDRVVGQGLPRPETPG
ncbi:DUF1194 domain-containing protein [Pseudoponticoccus marisrubri]|uniref:VWFA domain-containing protein n=1 Tax=Pseudoponticoccus marisrubri TaxID=1685382 RepID=A0A0W7WH23_9RHOB|nr:DUF1194 domain-containing protein [Pseudoponticoccus marisrubri]KUF09768.1 hypothetical protein AVJ23_15940 [Pseudoponticoccus marisrubri]